MGCWMLGLKLYLVSESLCVPSQQLQMLGYDISWAAFNIIEVMSASKFTFKVSLLWGLNPVLMGTRAGWVPWVFLQSVL